MAGILQTKVRASQAWARPGQVTKGSHSYYMDADGIVVDDKVRVGCFVKQKTTSAKDYREVVGASDVAVTSGDKIVGIVIIPPFKVGNEMSDTINKGENIKICTKGSVAIEAKSTANYGQYVFLKDADGSLVFNDTDTLASHTFTGWRVTRPTSTSVTDPEIIEVTSI